ncbi:MAG: hypothetical protein WC413_04000 [Candidatus Nanoarchaeia archaeon]
MFSMLKKRLIVFLNILIFIPMVNAAFTGMTDNMVNMIGDVLGLAFGLVKGITEKLISLLQQSPMYGKIFLSILAAIILYDALKQTPMLKGQEGSSKKAGIIAVLIGLISAIGMPDAFVEMIFQNVTVFFGFIVAALILTIFKGKSRVSHFGKFVGYLALLYSFGAVSIVFGNEGILAIVNSLFALLALILMFYNIWKTMSGITSGRDGGHDGGSDGGDGDDGGGDGGNGNVDLGPIINRMDNLETGIDRRFNELRSDVGGVRTVIEDVRGMVTDMQETLENLSNFLTNWEGYFARIINSLGGLQGMVQQGIDIGNENKTILNSISENCKKFGTAFTNFVNIFETEIKKLTDKINDLSPKMNNVISELSSIRTNVNAAKDSIDRVEKELKSKPDMQDIQKELDPLKKDVGNILTFLSNLQPADMTKIITALNNSIVKINGNTNQKFRTLKKNLDGQFTAIIALLNKITAGNGTADDLRGAISGCKNVVQVIGDGNNVNVNQDLAITKKEIEDLEIMLQKIDQIGAIQKTLKQILERVQGAEVKAETKIKESKKKKEVGAKADIRELELAANKFITECKTGRIPNQFRNYSYFIGFLKQQNLGDRNQMEQKFGANNLQRIANETLAKVSVKK